MKRPTANATVPPIAPPRQEALNPASRRDTARTPTQATPPYVAPLSLHFRGTNLRGRAAHTPAHASTDLTFDHSGIVLCRACNLRKKQVGDG